MATLIFGACSLRTAGPLSSRASSILTMDAAAAAASASAVGRGAIDRGARARGR